MNVNRDLPRAFMPSYQSFSLQFLAVIGLFGLGLVGLTGSVLAQNEQQARCMQLQTELAAAQGGGGVNRVELGRIEQQIAQADRTYQGTRSAMESAGCFESFLIFGKALVRSPKCLGMNSRMEGARRQLAQLQQQRQTMQGGGRNKRRVAELNDALARSGCGGVRARRGLFDFFGGSDEEDMVPQERMPVYRNVNPNGSYRTVCVRLCDGFYFPISYAKPGYRVGEDAQRCQANCAAPAELYVYNNPGGEIEQAFSLQGGSAYMDLPVALKFRREYVKGCSCKQAEYNPTQIEAANKRAEADANTPAAPAPAAPSGPPPQLDLDMGADTPAAPAPGAPAAQAPAAPEAASPPPPAEAQAEPQGQSSMVKKSTPPAATPQ